MPDDKEVGFKDDIHYGFRDQQFLNHKVSLPFGIDATIPNRNGQTASGGTSGARALGLHLSAALNLFMGKYITNH